MNNKNELLISVANWIEQSNEIRNGTFSCGLASLERNQYNEYCAEYLICDVCPFWINPGMETLCDTLLEYSK
jgi:hypothetical protein